jgi:hypothetical protein
MVAYTDDKSGAHANEWTEFGRTDVESSGQANECTKWVRIANTRVECRTADCTDG